ncbi:alpha/beta fold hydrolase [Nakamurella endophytica]|uniref:Alpha/beta hydrolase n=1 Tax=Nakamurella endophytica TaxID=1748367 RepID=A0A917ST52_9ACTN|nr:alpha/beta hydrolase [Nakamurella endophytica]GGL97660.1 alpha/beta hydrolase [Nakamurella endophytica]
MDLGEQAHSVGAASPARRVRVNGIELAYETFGDPAGTPLLLVMGLGTQMLGWPDEFCRMLAAEGFCVTRFDNRDIGLSQHMTGAPVPNPVGAYLRRSRPPYTVADMADDAAGLIDALGHDSMHVVGASMGGFISQELAIRHPRKVRSLGLIMTSTGSRRVGRTAPRVALAVLKRRVVTDRAGAVEASLATQRLIGSPGFPLDTDRVRAVSGAAYDRAFDPEGVRRQLAAVTGQRDRTADLRRLDVPTLVVHGLADPLVSVSGGLALARTIPGAKFLGYAGMAHDLPAPLWTDLIGELVALTRRAGQPGPGVATAGPADAATPDVLGV